MSRTCSRGTSTFFHPRLVLNEDGMTSGKLVSFLLLLSSLSDAFNNMGSIFSAMAQALGAAEKVLLISDVNAHRHLDGDVRTFKHTHTNKQTHRHGAAGL